MDGSERAVTQGDFVLVQPNEKHQYRTRRGRTAHDNLRRAKSMSRSIDGP